VLQILFFFLDNNALTLNFSPLCSCINPLNPIRQNLSRLLNLALFCQKYQCSELQTFIENLAIPLMQTNNLPSNLTKELTFLRVAEIAHTLNHTDMSAVSQSIVVANLWENGVTNAFEALVLGECINDKLIIGTAYYQILVSQSPKWTEDPRLNERHC